MSNINNGGPAFPHVRDNGLAVYDGATLRDYFAAKAMQAYMADPNASWGIDGIREASSAAYRVADAMLGARKK